MLSNLPDDWDQLRQKLIKNAAIYSQPEKLVQLLDICATSLVLRPLTIQLSRSRLVFCRYAGDTAYPSLYGTKTSYVVASFSNDEQFYFSDLNELLSFVEDRIATVDKEKLPYNLG